MFKVIRRVTPSSRGYTTRSAMRMFTRPPQKSLEERLTVSSEQFARRWELKGPITGPIYTSDPELRKIFNSPYKPVTPEEIVENCNVMEIARRNGPSW